MQLQATARSARRNHRPRGRRPERQVRLRVARSRRRVRLYFPAFPTPNYRKVCMAIGSMPKPKPQVTTPSECGKRVAAGQQQSRNRQGDQKSGAGKGKKEVPASSPAPEQVSGEHRRAIAERHHAECARINPGCTEEGGSNVGIGRELPDEDEQGCREADLDSLLPEPRRRCRAKHRRRSVPLRAVLPRRGAGVGRVNRRLSRSPRQRYRAAPGRTSTPQSHERLL